MLHITLLSISKLMYLELFGAQAQKVAVRCYSLSLDDLDSLWLTLYYNIFVQHSIR